MAVNIIITGKSGVGKSLLANKLKNHIFKTDSNSQISIREKDEQNKDTGSGENVYVIEVGQSFTKEEMDTVDIVIEIKSNALVNRIKEL